MILCLDIGNSHIFGGVFEGDQILLRFRHVTQRGNTSDQLGIFLRSVLRENAIATDQIKQIAICSVVPQMDYSLKAACIKYFNIEPFELNANVKTGLKIKYPYPNEVGADRIANAIAASNQFPQQDIIVVDLGTATTFCIITAGKEYFPGPIVSGMRISMDALQRRAAKLFAVDIVKPKETVAQSTRHGIQAGLYYSQLGAIREITQRLAQEVFDGKSPMIIGTGGLAYLFESEELFAAVAPDLVLHGLRLALDINGTKFA